MCDRSFLYLTIFVLNYLNKKPSSISSFLECMEKIMKLSSMPLLYCCVMFFIPLTLMAEDNANISENGMVDQNLTINQSYTYNVPFNGDFDESHEFAFSELIKQLSKGSMNPSEIAIDVGSMIQDEQITDDSLVVTFKNKSVEELIASGKIKVWEGLPDPVIVWIVKEPALSSNSFENDEPAAELISSNVTGTFAEKLKVEGINNGITIIYPMMDLDDMQNLSIPDVMLGKPDVISKASVRYTAGMALDGMLVTEGKRLKLIYHLISVSDSKELFSDTVVGSEEEIINLVYTAVRMNLCKAIQSNSSMVVNENGNGFLSIEALNLGEQANNHVRILIRNTQNFAQMVEIRDNLLKIGFISADIVDVKAGDVIFDISFNKGVLYKQMMEMYHNLQLLNDFVYIYSIHDETSSTEVKNVDKNIQEDLKNNETNRDIQYNGSDSGESTTNNTTSSSYPDPNKKLRTGGGIKE